MTIRLTFATDERQRVTVEHLAPCGLFHFAATILCVPSTLVRDLCEQGYAVEVL